jgi:hypothetical protein
MDNHYWKDAYKESWDASSKKEQFIKSIIEKETGLTVIEIGLGAGSSEFIVGNAKENHHEKGDADLYIKEIDAYIEVTGPNIPMFKNATLWFRPDKLNNTYKKIINNIGKLHVLIHVQEVKNTSDKLIRCIILDNAFFERGKNKEFVLVTPTIRGRQEKYIEIASDDKALINIDDFIFNINNLKK